MLCRYAKVLTREPFMESAPVIPAAEVHLILLVPAQAVEYPHRFR